eukprot:438508_1
MSTSNTITTPNEVTIYWDYETMSLNKQMMSNFSILLTLIKSRLFFAIGCKLPINIRLYIHSSNITKDIQQTFDCNEINIIEIPNINFNTISEKLTFDANNYIEMLQNNNNNTLHAIALISSDINFDNLLFNLKQTPLISHIFLILFQDISMNDKLILTKHIDDIFQIYCDNHDDDIKENTEQINEEEFKTPNIINYDNISNSTSTVPLQNVINYPITVQNIDPYIYNPYPIIPLQLQNWNQYFPQLQQYIPNTLYSTYLNSFPLINPSLQINPSLIIPQQNDLYNTLQPPIEMNNIYNFNSSLLQQQQPHIDTPYINNGYEQLNGLNEQLIPLETNDINETIICDDISDNIENKKQLELFDNNNNDTE